VNRKKCKLHFTISGFIFIIILTLVIGFLIGAVFKAKVVVQPYQNINRFGDNKNYEMGYNSYDRPIFKSASSAIRQLKIDCSDGLEYLKQYRLMPELNTSFKVLQKYAVSCMETSINESIDNEEKVKADIVKIQLFAYTCWNGSVFYYEPFHKRLS